MPPRLSQRVAAASAAAAAAQSTSSSGSQLNLHARRHDDVEMVEHDHPPLSVSPVTAADASPVVFHGLPPAAAAPCEVAIDLQQQASEREQAALADSTAASDTADTSAAKLIRRQSSSRKAAPPLVRGSSSRRFSRQASVRKPKITESWPGSHHIRRLFRLFDRDGNGSISPSEFRAGLASLGFDVGNVAQLRLLQQELDVDRTGLIRESQFIHAFRTLNRKAIEAKLKQGASSGPLEEDQPVRIQLMKIGHASDGVGVRPSFHHERDITPPELGDILRQEEQAVRLAGDTAIRWLDICGLHSSVLALVSNFFNLPHDVLGEDIELEAAAHCDFFTGRPPNAGANAPDAAADTNQVDALREASVTIASMTSVGPDESTSQMPSLQRTTSVGGGAAALRPTPQSTLKLLIHSLQMHNFPLVPSDDGELKLIPYRLYKKQKCTITQVPIHIVIANDHTLITVRPMVNADGAPTVRAVDLTPPDGDEDDPNSLFDDFIETLADTDSTSLTGLFGLTSAKTLALRLWEDVIDANWSLRDQFKEWNIWLQDHTSDISDEYYLRQIKDFERLAATSVRIFRPLLNTIAALSGDHVDLTHSAYTTPARSAYRTSSTRNEKDLYTLPARAQYLKSVHSSLRILHRNIARQFDQANLSVTLAKALQEQYTQRGRDRSNDTLYLLTVVTTIVTPLQIMSGVYGMNWDNFPELHYQNGYYWFWGINIFVIIIIGCLFKFREGITWIRENLER